MHFRNYRLGKTELFKRLEGPVSELPSKVNILKGSKHCCILHDSTFTLLFDQSGKN